MLKIPIPMFYVSSDTKSVWSVVDGLQRMSTIRDFVLGKEYLKIPRKIKKKRIWHEIIWTRILGE